MIGLYGGTFNPVHFGHLRTALEIKELFQLKTLRLIPCSLPAHKSQPEVSAQIRLEMLKLAIADTPGLEVDSRELERDGPSYMVDTLQSIRAEVGDTPLLLIIGADAFAGLENWYQWQRLFDYAHLLVMTRPGYHQTVLSEFFQQRLLENRQDLQAKAVGGLIFQTVTLLDISATQIRKSLARNGNPQFLLPEKVLAFIKQHQLYQAAQTTSGH